MRAQFSPLFDTNGLQFTFLNVYQKHGRTVNRWFQRKATFLPFNFVSMNDICYEQILDTPEMIVERFCWTMGAKRIARWVVNSTKMSFWAKWVRVHCSISRESDSDRCVACNKLETKTPPFNDILLVVFRNESHIDVSVWLCETSILLAFAVIHISFVSSTVQYLCLE